MRALFAEPNSERPFPFSKNYQFSTDIKLKGEEIETINNIKLLGTIITNDLTWNENTKMIDDSEELQQEDAVSS